MPLLDHFHPPLSERRKWEGFHTHWASQLAAHLNARVLGDRYHAEPEVHVGGAIQVEVDVATFSDPHAGSGNGAVLAPAYAPPLTALVIPTAFPDDFEVRILSTNGMSLVAAVELVSPGNKDRPEARASFVAKCRAYLMSGIGLVVVDIVTDRLANLHNELMEELGQGGAFLLPPTPTYAVAYRPSRRAAGDQIEVWPAALALGQPLPTLPLSLRNAETVPLDLEVTYAEACVRSKLR